MTIATVLKELPIAGIGIVVGAFIPAVGRKIKALFVKETKSAEVAVESEAAKVEADVKAKV